MLAAVLLGALVAVVLLTIPTVLVLLALVDPPDDTHFWCGEFAELRATRPERIRRLWAA